MKKQNCFRKKLFELSDKLKFLKPVGLINKKAQVTVEYILLAVVLITLFQLASISLKDNQSLKNFQELPGSIFKHLVENGYGHPDEATSRKNHPNVFDRYYTPEGQGE